MTSPTQLLHTLSHLRTQTAAIHLHDDQYAQSIVSELYHIIDTNLPVTHNPLIRTALHDADAAAGRIDEYLDTPQGPEAHNHLDAATASLDDAILILSQLPPGATPP